MNTLEQEYKEWFKSNEKWLKTEYKSYLRDISDIKIKSFDDWVWDYYESIWE